MKFAELNLNPALVRAVAEKGYEIATPIQADAIPVILAGRDLVGCAQTGTGKTAAFALPTLERILESVKRAAPPQPRALPGGDAAPANDSAFGGERAPKNPRPEAGAERGDRQAPRHKSGRRKTRSLVLAPTRELCSQIAASFTAYGKHTPLRHTSIYGGVSQMHQVRALQHGVDVLIATPGRLLDLMQQGHVDLTHVEVLIFDEADQMLDMGFLPDLRRIVARVPKKRQTLMFSATMPEEIRKLANEWLVDPESVATAPIATPAERVNQSVYFVDKKEKPRLLAQWLERTPNVRTLVFARTKHGADKLVKHLTKEKLRAAAIHGNKSQGARERVLEQFKSSRPPILVATDVAARGLDIKEVSHVVNYDLPETPEVYVHRIGRTGRAGASGEAVSFCSVEEIGLLKAIERLTRRRIEASADHAEYNLGMPSAAAMNAGEQPSRSPRSGGPSRRGASGNRRRRPKGAGPGGIGRRPRTQGESRGAGNSGRGQGASAAGGTTAAAPAARPPKRKKRHLSRP